MATKPNPNQFSVEGASSGPALINGVIWLMVAFNLVNWDAEQIAAVTFVANLVFGGLAYLWMKFTTTSRANPTTADGTPLVPAHKPPTRGIEKGE